MTPLNPIKANVSDSPPSSPECVKGCTLTFDLSTGKVDLWENRRGDVMKH